ncbi:hypothetical protein CLPUN_30140 [Clostridium puniceum]|uniref:Stage 0 sporulation protein A homolog n=1 Tax=Clostridium puniceum TaxID=29367 RepID=A0A1S8TDT2_9CLOT|nr:hypothetical protein [Clostridium puniceum]OOM75977.1 hypothetical protein CLPUN_30140 [Clostridium puniceum]
MNMGKVLFVDDEENILNALRRGLIDADYEYFFVSNGLEALEIINNNVINEYLKVYNGAFIIKTIDSRVIIKIRLIKSGK